MMSKKMLGIFLIAVLVLVPVFSGCATLDKLSRDGKARAVQILMDYVCDALEEKEVLTAENKDKYCPLIERIIINVVNEENILEDEELVKLVVAEIACDELINRGFITEEQGANYCPVVDGIVQALIDGDKGIPMEDIITLLQQEILKVLNN